MAGKRYNQEAKDRALAALMASATEVDGEWVPNYRAVEKHLGISDTTLIRWWSRRNRALDMDLRGATTRVRSEVMEESVSDWVAGRWEQWREYMGKVFTEESTNGLSADKFARAVLLYRQALSGCEADMSTGETDRAANGSDRMARLKHRARMAGLLDD